MIAEKLPLRFDIDKLQDYFLSNVKPFAAVWQSKTFGGWSILSATGDYKDGFQRGHEFFISSLETGATVFDHKRAAAEIGFTDPAKHVIPTQMGGGYIHEMIEQIKHYGLKPHRARWTVVTHGGYTDWHRDNIETRYGVRLHIPIITNEGCSFTTEEGDYHMPADGSCYLVAVNLMHKAVNQGSDDRIHIIMDVIDQHGISQHHKLSQHIEKYGR